MADTNSNVQLNTSAPAQATKQSTGKGKVHIKIPKSEPVKPVEVNPKAETTIPQSTLVVNDRVETVESSTPTTVPPPETPKEPEIAEEPTRPLIFICPPPPEKLITPPKLTDEDLLARAGDNPILFLLRRNRDLEEIIAFQTSELLGLGLDKEFVIKAMTDISNANARLDTLELQIADLKEGHTDSKAIMSGRVSVQIRDKTTNKVYKSKNNVYQSLLKDGLLKELVDLGVFGPKPEKNSFGWYQLKRAFPDRFEEVTADTKPADIPTPEVK